MLKHGAEMSQKRESLKSCQCVSNFFQAQTSNVFVSTKMEYFVHRIARSLRPPQDTVGRNHEGKGPLERQHDLESEDKFNAMSRLSPYLSPKSMVESTSKSKSYEAADVTLTTAGLTLFDDEMFQSIVDEKDGRTIAVPDNFPDESSLEVVSSLHEEKVESFILHRSKIIECQSKHCNQTMTVK